MLVPVEEAVVSPPVLPRELRRHLLVKRGGRTLVRCFVHPAALADHALDIADHGLERGCYLATPTSSTRSLVAWRRDGTGLPFGLKLSIDVDIQRIPRLLRWSKLECARAITRAVDGIGHASLAAAGVSFLREPVTLRLTPDLLTCGRQPLDLARLTLRPDRTDC